MLTADHPRAARGSPAIIARHRHSDGKQGPEKNGTQAEISDTGGLIELLPKCSLKSRKHHFSVDKAGPAGTH